MNFTPQQQAVIDSPASQILVSAGPGSGKSAVLLARVARLIDGGVPASRIVVITYTNAAAKELTDRLSSEPASAVDCAGSGTDAGRGVPGLHCGPNGASPCAGLLAFIGTLHGWLLGLLTQHGSLIGLAGPLAVVDEEEQKALLTDALDETAYRGSLKAVEAEVAKGPILRFNTMTRQEIAAEAFWQKLKTDGILTYDSILFYGLRLLMKSPAVVNADFIFCDEGQDLSAQDWRILDAAQVPNVMVIGDPRQQIFSFRGASEQFAKRCLNDNAAQLLTLQENFRCCSEVCRVANKLMAGQPFPQTISATGESGQFVVSSIGFETDDQEAHAVAGDILAWINDSNLKPHIRANNCAVLVRTNHLADYFRTVLKAHGLPVKEKAKPDLPADWGRAKAALALLANPDNDRLAYQAIRMASGQQRADEVSRAALERFQTINDTALFLPNDFKAHDCGKALAKMGVSRESLDRIGKAASLLKPDAAVNALVLAVASQAQDEVEGDGVTISTLHGAKGKEWQAVWLPAWENETIPGSRKGTDEAEERRLAFVGITRAKSYLWVSWAKRRAQQWGGPKDCTVSQFVSEIL